jgi:DNA (cytosine-5)-methyltransferase 1
MKTRNIGMNKGKRRIWLQNGELTDNGIHHGMRFDAVPSGNVLEIIINPEGKRKIAGGPDRPIIDMAGKIVTDAFGDDVASFTIEKFAKGIRLVGVKS